MKCQQVYPTQAGLLRLQRSLVLLPIQNHSSLLFELSWRATYSSGTTVMHMAESSDGPPSCCSKPTLTIIHRICYCLCHAKGQRGSSKDMTAVRSPDERVYEIENTGIALSCCSMQKVLQRQAGDGSTTDSHHERQQRDEKRKRGSVSVLPDRREDTYSRLHCIAIRSRHDYTSTSSPHCMQTLSLWYQ